jgi:sugar lactone lactonase YvrE
MYQRLLLLVVVLHYARSQNSKVRFNLSGAGMQYLPVDSVQLIDSVTISPSSSLTRCAAACSTIIPLCRIFDFDSSTGQCRLFEGDLTTGQIIPSTSLPSNSVVGSMILTNDLYTSYGQPCSQCIGNRFMTCHNSTCECPSGTYFTGSTCQSQGFIGAPCNSTHQCRSDCNLTCLQFLQCGRKSSVVFVFSIMTIIFSLSLALSGLQAVTVAGYGNSTSGNDAMGLNSPTGLYTTFNGDVYVADRDNHRIQLYRNGSRTGKTVAGNGTAGSTTGQLDQPTSVTVDASSGNIFISDTDNGRIQIWSVNTTQGHTFVNGLNFPSGLRVDAQNYVYVVESSSDQILRWSPNGTNQTVVAGIGSARTDNRSLNTPLGIDFDASGQYLYIADCDNHRVQKWKLPINNTEPAIAGVTVAGGNGAGTGSNQLQNPRAVYVSKKTNAVYVADTGNNRITRCVVGATQGVTIAGDPNGVSGSSSSQLNGPSGITLDPSETYLFVSDQGNNKIQRFTLT